MSALHLAQCVRLLLLLVVVAVLASVASASDSEVVRVASTLSSPGRAVRWVCVSSPSSASPSDSQDCSAADRAPPSAPHRFQWLLPQHNEDWLKQQLAEVSDHTHPRYQQWMSKAEVLAHIAPPADTVQEVIDWMLAGGVQNASIINRGDVLLVHTQVGVVESLFSTQLHVYRHVSNRTTTRSAGDLTIPAALLPALHSLRGVAEWPVESSHIVAVVPQPAPARHSTTSFGSSSNSAAERGAGHLFHPTQVEQDPQTCTLLDYEIFGSDFTPVASPQWLALQYNLSDRSLSTTSSGQIAAVAGGYEGSDYQAFSQNDLNQFCYDVGIAKQCSPIVFNTNLLYLEQQANGAAAPAGGEADLESEQLHTSDSPAFAFLVATSFRTTDWH